MQKALLANTDLGPPEMEDHNSMHPPSHTLIPMHYTGSFLVLWPSGSPENSLEDRSGHCGRASQQEMRPDHWEGRMGWEIAVQRSASVGK